MEGNYIGTSSFYAHSILPGRAAVHDQRQSGRRMQAVSIAGAIRVNQMISPGFRTGPPRSDRTAVFWPALLLLVYRPLGLDRPGNGADMRLVGKVQVASRRVDFYVAVKWTIIEYFDSVSGPVESCPNRIPTLAFWDPHTLYWGR
ncbi:hypothetical protein J6590_005243 [Homalodisca vitripennis]|nr:hypothetical protein J6590_005243 [Homalodisca vitripennis]